MGKHGRRRLVTSVAATAAASAQGVESLLLESMYKALAIALHIDPARLGALTTARGVTQSLVSLFVGALGDRYHRGWIITAGTLAWAVFSACFGLSTTYGQALAFAALSGCGLALVTPCVVSIIADLWEEHVRGRAFGSVLLVGSLATMVGLVVAINLANKRLFGRIEGWRVVYFAAAALGLITALVAALFISEPRYADRAPWRGADPASNPSINSCADPHSSQELRARRPRWSCEAAAGFAQEFAGHLWAVARTPSFLVILVEHISSLTRAATGYQLLYMQMLGFSDGTASGIAIGVTLGAALGQLAGGATGDALSRRWPNAARPFSNQLSLALTVPLIFLVLKGMPASSAHATGVPGSADKWAWAYGLLLLLSTLLGTWCNANNQAIMAMVIPSPLRTTAYALDSCIAGVLGFASTPLVGLLAQHAGYRQSFDVDMPPAEAAAEAVRNARALENSLLLLILVACGAKFVVYTALYWTIRRDRLDDEKDAGS
ncbi:hypothetical protein WJX81_002901 [Elliptochloris bilobata]|uniref:Major facilitator superfamily (MFS) profile domain-containing protein n=1 Tax=Elliptochloris bilobata TaxID=381761 RepID=A0AAW1SCA2_9CHLO